jgi:GNAT superfamily N-acetyltransferase
MEKEAHALSIVIKELKFRTATGEDAEHILSIYLASRKQCLSYAPLAHTDEQVRTWVREILIPSGGVTVGIIDDTIVGFIATSRAESHTWLDQLYVNPSFIGTGVGSALLRFSQTQLTCPIRLYTFQQNERARRFYLRHGFREIEFTDGSANEERVPDILMEWP